MKDKAVDFLVTEDTKIDGKEVPKGTLLTGIDVDLAYSLAGSGKGRMASDEDKAEAAKAAKGKKAE